MKNDRDEPLVTRLLLRIEIDEQSGCWLWTRGTNDAGYGRFAIAHDKNVAPHRWAYEFWVGLIPLGYTVDHMCHNSERSCAGGPTCAHRRCINPDHLEAVTLAVNLSRTTTLSTLNAAKTHCPAGHAYTERNTYVRQGMRTCRACKRDRAAATRALRRR